MCVNAEICMAAFWLVDHLKPKLYPGAVPQETTRGIKAVCSFQC